MQRTATGRSVHRTFWPKAVPQDFTALDFMAYDFMAQAQDFMAQDFMAAFNVGDSDRHIHMVDANGVNMAAIKALNTRLEEKDAQISTLQEQLDEVMKRLDELS